MQAGHCQAGDGGTGSALGMAKDWGGLQGQGREAAAFASQHFKHRENL